MTFARNFSMGFLGTVLAAPGLAGSMIMPLPVLSEIVDDDAARHGYRREGIFLEEPCHFPPKGRPQGEIFAELERFKARDLDWKAGRVWAYVYNPGDEVREVVNRAYTMFLTENALDPTVFPSLLRLEMEVVRMVADLLRGDENVVGHLTTGGTESNMLAVKTARDWARAHRPEITQPEMVLPITAHGSFHKAAHYLGVRPVVVETDPRTFQVDPQAMRAAITPHTILLVASAPNWSQGVVDPIPQIAEIFPRGRLCGWVLPLLPAQNGVSSPPSPPTCTSTVMRLREPPPSFTAVRRFAATSCCLRPYQHDDVEQ